MCACVCLHSLVQGRTLRLVAGEPREDIAVVPGPQRRGRWGSVAISGPDEKEMAQVKGEEEQKLVRMNYIHQSNCSISIQTLEVEHCMYLYARS